MSVSSIDVRREIGVFLRQQRQQRDATQFPGLVNRRRHVPYVTQADLAELAGVSDALVAQIENGRYENLNPAIVIKLAMALKLAPNQEQYLLNFLQPQNGNLEPAPDEMPEMLRALVRSSMPNPAMIVTPRMDIVDWNHNAARMIVDFSRLPDGERNIAFQMFQNPVMRERWVDWEDNVRKIVGGLRMTMSQSPVYRDEIMRLATFLSGRDPRFREWWGAEEPVLAPNREKDFLHPEFGRLRIYQTAGAVLGSPHHTFVLMTPRDDETEIAFRNMAG